MRCEYIGSTGEPPYAKRCDGEASQTVSLREDNLQVVPQEMEVCDECADAMVANGGATVVG